MARKRRIGKGGFFSRPGESTSVESSSRYSQDLVVSTTTRRKGKNQITDPYDCDAWSRDSYFLKPGESSSTAEDRGDTAAGKPDLEAYCRGSWWDVQVLKKDHDNYLVHYENFPHSQDEWLPLTHLRVRCRTSTIADCCEIEAGNDVCVMTPHKHCEEKSAAWFDAKVIDIVRKPHTPKCCKCAFRVSLYSIPAILPRDCKKRTLLPVSLNHVTWKTLSIMREPKSMGFEEMVVAALPNAINSPTIWAKDGNSWSSSFDYCGPFWEHSPSSESRVASGDSVSRGHYEEYIPIVDPDLKPFGSFLEEEDLMKYPPTLSSVVMNDHIYESDGDVVIVSVVLGSKEPAIKPQLIELDVDDAAACENDAMADAAAFEIDAMDYAACENDAMDDVAADEYYAMDDSSCENDAMDVVALCDDDGYTCVDRYPSDEEYDEGDISLERPEEVLKTAFGAESLGDFQEEVVETAMRTESLGDFQEEVVKTAMRAESVGDFQEEVVKTSMRAESVGDFQEEVVKTATGAESLVDFQEEVVKTAMGAETLENFQEELDEVVLSDLQPTEEEMPWKPISSVPLPAEPATSFENSDGDDDFAQLLEERIIAGDEESDDDGFAAYLEKHIVNNCGPKRTIAVGATAPAVTAPAANAMAAKRRRSGYLRPARKSPKPPLAISRDKEMVRPKVSSSQPKKTAKEPGRVYERQASISAAFASSPGDSNGDTIAMEKFQYRDAAMMLDPDDPPMADILAHSRDASRMGLSTQPSLVKEKRPKKFSNAALPKKLVKEITYAELFKNVDPVQCILPSEKDPEEESGLLPSWNPFLESMRLESLHRDADDDQYADVWREMRSAMESVRVGNEEVGEMEEESATKLHDRYENSRMDCVEHIVEFDQLVGEVCGECGLVLRGIQDMWVHDNPRRIGTIKEGDDDSDEEIQEIHGNSEYGYSAWDSDDDLQENDIEEGSNIELIPDLAKKMQTHQKQGFHFLWRNLAGQDCNGNQYDPRVEPGGCVLSHAPGTGKTFLIISFLQSYMKKYPNCRPLIVAPKIMLQPWEKEFQKWNVDIPVHNFNRANEQGRRIFQKHQESGVVQYVRQKSILNVLREAMLWEWQETPSVLVISYSMFNRVTLIPQPTLSTIKRILLDKPSIAVLDEGHNARNSSSQVGRQLMAIKTPLRILLSGTLFQNNFEELYTCLNLARSGFVHTFARSAGLKLSMQQETEIQTNFEDERSAAEWKEKAAKALEAQAKKLFIEEIGNRIDKGQLAYSTPEYAQGLAYLRRLTTHFVHHYEGGVLRGLPPLRDFTIVLQPTALQEKMIKSVTNRMKEKTMLEQEGLLSFVCVHPFLLSRHNVGKTFTDLLSPEEMKQADTDDPASGVKTRFVINLLEKLQDQGNDEKMLIFCQNLHPLALVEGMLKARFGWVREQEILHIDGKVTPDERQSIIGRFNDPQGRIRVLLLSTKACGEGITLTGASRVVFMDVLWNPAVLRQAIHRAFRLGQTKVVHVYRLVLTDCLEEEKYKRMVLKDLKSQAIFSPASKKVDPSGTPLHNFWEVKKQSSKDPVLNELERQDAGRDQPAFKHVFRHGGLFDDEYDDDPEGEGVNATEWLRNQRTEILDSSYDSDLVIECDTPESYDIEDGEMEGGAYDSDADDDIEDVLLASELNMLPI